MATAPLALLEGARMRSESSSQDDNVERCAVGSRTDVLRLIGSKSQTAARVRIEMEGSQGSAW